MAYLVEEMILNPKAIQCGWHPNAMKGWRRYRIEYGFECGCPEGVIYLPPDIDSEAVEDYLNKLCRTWVTPLNEEA